MGLIKVNPYWSETSQKPRKRKHKPCRKNYRNPVQSPKLTPTENPPILPSIVSAIKSQAEMLVSDELAIALNGTRESINPVGRVDVLTSDYVIEVKVASDWKHAIGQVFVYGFYYPDKKPALYLFGENLDYYLISAKFHCDRLNIKLATSIIDLHK